MKKKRFKKIIFITTIALLIILTISGIAIGSRVKSQMKDLFRMNDELKAEGYYMGDFEFKMLGFAYYLDKGHFIKALSGINKLQKELKTKEGIIKIPEFTSKEDEMEFYLNLQNPETGAFIDDSCPYCMYNDVTENIISHLDELARETGKPLKLKYPLKYLDEINTPEKLNAFLDDVSHVGWIANKFPQTTFFSARSILSYCNGESAIAENNLYEFSPEWKKTLLKWFYENQDPDTGFWGPKSKIKEHLLRRDLTNTASIIKTFLDENGNNIYKEFPLKYKDRMFKTALEVLYESMPSDDELDEWHEWSLKMGKGTAMLTRYLWGDASSEYKAKASKIFKNFVKVSFEKHYITKKGAFSYNPNSQNATLDGTGSKISNLNDLGFFSPEKQKYLWGDPGKSMVNLGTCLISSVSIRDFGIIANSKEVNSVRLYQTDPDYGNLTSNVYAVIYPHKTPVLDALDLAPKVRYWVETTSQTMGNWTSREEVLKNLKFLKKEEVSVYEEVPLKDINKILQRSKRIVVVGFDVLQLPRYKITYELKNG